MEGKEREVAGGIYRNYFTLPREVARRYLDRYPKEGYNTCVAHWYVTNDGQINFTMRRLPPCD